MKSPLAFRLFTCACLAGPCLPLRAAVSGNFTYTDNGADITITDYPNDATGPVSIPPLIANKPVTGIGDFAFESCTGITAVTFPGSLKHIGASSFLDCGGLTTVKITPGIVDIADFAFSNCDSLDSITVDPNNPNF